MYWVRSVNAPSRVNVGTSMSLSPSTSGGSPALIEVARDVTSSLIDVSVSLTWRFLWVALNSLTSFWARVLETVRAQNWTVPVAFTPNEDEAADEEAADGDPDDEHAAAAASSMTAAAPVRVCLGESFIAVSCSRYESGSGNQGGRPVARLRKPFSQKARNPLPDRQPLGANRLLTLTKSRGAARRGDGRPMPGDGCPALR